MVIVVPVLLGTLRPIVNSPGETALLLSTAVPSEAVISATLVSSLTMTTVALLGPPTVYPVPLTKVKITVSLLSMSSSLIGVIVMVPVLSPSSITTDPERLA